MKEIQKDRYQKNRGRARVLHVMCENCEAHIAYYQKDGPGLLKRMYVDRFMDFTPSGAKLRCGTCKLLIGTYFIYEKEKRPSYRLFAGAIKKNMISQAALKKLR